MSSGADILLHMATRQPGRVKAIVLVGSASYIPEQERAIERETKYEDWNWDHLRQQHVYGDDQIRALIDQFRDCADSYDDINFTPPYLSTITAQTLIVHGDRDPFRPIPIPTEMYTSIPNAYLWIVPNGGHLPVYDKHKAAFVQTALEFLRGDWEAS
jgi:pimeloyl-ACP methyl ester carboxylesterase